MGVLFILEVLANGGISALPRCTLRTLWTPGTDYVMCAGVSTLSATFC